MSKLTHSYLRHFFLLSLFAFLLGSASASRSLAQSAVAGAMSGTITDPNGAVISNATVTIKNIGTNKEETGTTSADGNFRFNNLQPGIYSVTIAASGFSTSKKELTVEVGRMSNADTKLTVGAAEATVTIVAEASLVNTESKEFTSNINQTAINELPINGRRWSNFAILTPGVVPDGSFGLISFRGISGLLNNNTIDGGDNNQAFFSAKSVAARVSVIRSASRRFVSFRSTPRIIPPSMAARQAA